MKKITVTLLFMLLITFGGLSAVQAESSKQRIFDDANLLTTEEIAKLEKLAEKYSVKRERDFLIFTKDNEEKDIGKYMDDYYDEHAPGFDKAHGNTAMLGIDVHEMKRDVVLHCFGKAEKYLDSNRLTLIQEQIIPDLSDGNYFDAFVSFILLSDKYMNYRPGVNPENPFYKTWVQFAIAIVLGIIVVGMMAYHVNPKMTTNASTYQDMNRTKVLNKRDRYIRTTVTKRRKPKQSSSGGGGSGGGGIGRTSGGFSRSSSRGKF